MQAVLFSGASLCHVQWRAWQEGQCLCCWVVACVAAAAHSLAAPCTTPATSVLHAHTSHVCLPTVAATSQVLYAQAIKLGLALAPALRALHKELMT